MSHFSRRLVAASAFAAAMLITAGVAQAQVEPDTRKAVTFTFNQPVTLPNLTLPAGKYYFVLTSGPSAHDVITVYNANRTKALGFFITVPIQRNTYPDKAEVRFMEAAAGTAPPIQSYFFPGTKTGWEFVYPRQQALQLAKAAKAPVVTTTRELPPEQVKAADLAIVTAEGQQTAYTETSPAVPVAAAVQQGEVVQAPAPAQSQAMAEPPARTALPKTASNTPLVALGGLLLLSLGLALGFWRRRLV